MHVLSHFNFCILTAHEKSSSVFTQFSPLHSTIIFDSTFPCPMIVVREKQTTKLLLLNLSKCSKFEWQIEKNRPKRFFTIYFDRIECKRQLSWICCPRLRWHIFDVQPCVRACVHTKKVTSHVVHVKKYAERKRERK